MKKHILIIFIFFGFFASAQVTVIDSIFTGGMYRNYRIYIPAIYTGTTAAGDSGGIFYLFLHCIYSVT